MRSSRLRRERDGDFLVAYCGPLVSSALFQSLVVYSSGQGGEGGADERTRFWSELVSSIVLR